MVVGVLFWSMMGIYIAGSVFALLYRKDVRAANTTAHIANAIAAVTGLVLSIVLLLSSQTKLVLLDVPTNIPILSVSLQIDHLSAFFLLPLSLLTLAIALYSIGYLRGYIQHHPVGYFNFLFGLFIVAMIAVLCAGNLTSFLIAWEAMAFVSFFLVIFEDGERANRRAASLYFIMTHVASAFLIIAFALLYKYTGSLGITANIAVPLVIKNILFGCFLIGFGTKAGIIPLHIWLPLAHPAAPSNVSALMSGMMIKTAVYGMIRFVLIGLGGGPSWWGTLLLFLGLLSLVLGVAYALIESNFKRLLAYSSIENIGLIWLALGVALWGKSGGNHFLLALGLVAALLHLLNHSIFKGLLFLGAGAVHQATGTKDLEELGGLLKRMPQTGLFLLAGCLAAAALPPFNGFIGEWLTFQALLVSILKPVAGSPFPAMLAITGLGLAGAMAAACFVKFFGIGFLGRPRSEAAATARESGAAMRTGMGILAGLSLLLGVFPGVILTLLNRFVAEVSGIAVMKSFHYQGYGFMVPVTGFRASLAPLNTLFLVALAVGLVWLAVKWAAGENPGRTYGTWDCGYEGLTPRMQYSATGFSKPFRIIFRGIFRPDRVLQAEEGVSPYHQRSLRYVVSTESVFEKYLYRPAVKTLTAAALTVKKRIQTGSIHAYLIYMFLMIVILLIYYIFN